MSIFDFFEYNLIIVSSFCTAIGATYIICISASDP